MAITQQRLINLLETIAGIQIRMKALHAFIERQKPAFYGAGDLETMKQIYENLVSATSNATILSREEFENFVREENHFKFSAGKNRASAEASKRYRQRMKLRQEQAENEGYLDSIISPNSSPEIIGKPPAQPLNNRPLGPEGLTLEDLIPKLIQIQSELADPLHSLDLDKLIKSLGGTQEDTIRWFNILLTDPRVSKGKFNGEFLIRTDIAA